MSDKKIGIGDEMIKTCLEKNSNKLSVSLDELIDRYIRRGIYSDDYSHMRPELSREELEEITKKDVEMDRKRGIKPKKHNFGVFIGRLNKKDD